MKIFLELEDEKRNEAFKKVFYAPILPDIDIMVEKMDNIKELLEGLKLIESL